MMNTCYAREHNMKLAWSDELCVCISLVSRRLTKIEYYLELVMATGILIHENFEIRYIRIF